MGEYRTLQKQITVRGDTTSGSFAQTQPLDQFTDVRNWGVAFLTLHTLTISKDASDTVVIAFGTVDTMRSGGLDTVPNGAAGVCVEFSGVSSNQFYKAFVDLTDEPQGAGTYPLENLLGWNLDVQKGGSGGPFSVTFEAFVTLKRPS